MQQSCFNLCELNCFYNALKEIIDTLNNLCTSRQNRCDLPQMHLLSVAMENNLHKTCPPNCQDMLVWLPYTVTLKILMYLDPGKVYRAFFRYANF